MILSWSCLFSVVLCSTVAIGIDEPEPSAEYDCGTLALFNLLKLENRQVRFDEVISSLPQLKPQGFSLLELREAASKHGLTLSGIKLDSPRFLTGPLLAHLRSKESNHFVVVRPVGTDRRFVQILDGLQPSRVVEAGHLLASSDWTGRVLIVDRPWSASKFVSTVPLILTAIFFSVGVNTWWTARRRAKSAHCAA